MLTSTKTLVESLNMRIEITSFEKSQHARANLENKRQRRPAAKESSQRQWRIEGWEANDRRTRRPPSPFDLFCPAATHQFANFWAKWSKEVFLVLGWNGKKCGKSRRTSLKNRRKPGSSSTTAACANSFRLCCVLRSRTSASLSP